MSSRRDTDKLPRNLKPPRREGRLIVWENGKPVPVYAPPLAKEQVSQLLTAAMSLEYKGDRDDQGRLKDYDLRFEGMTNAEVMAIRLAEKAANGSERAATELLDRIMGKPKQSHETVGVRMTYQDFLKQLAGEDNDDFQDLEEMVSDLSEKSTVIDVSILDDDDFDDLDLSDIFGDSQ